MGKPAVFLDRDGTLIEERCYPARTEQVKLLPGAAAALEKLRHAGFVCVVVTNQAGVGRGLLTEDQLATVNAEMHRQLAEAGTRVDGLYCCTFAPLGNDKTVVEHPDRKPGPGMLLRTAAELDLELAQSWIVGDSVSDILAGRNAGCLGEILVRSGHDLSEAMAHLGNDVVVLDDLAAAAEHIIARSHQEPRTQ